MVRELALDVPDVTLIRPDRDGRQNDDRDDAAEDSAGPILYRTGRTWRAP